MTCSQGLTLAWTQLLNPHWAVGAVVHPCPLLSSTFCAFYVKVLAPLKIPLTLWCYSSRRTRYPLGALKHMDVWCMCSYGALKHMDVGCAVFALVIMLLISTYVNMYVMCMWNNSYFKLWHSSCLCDGILRIVLYLTSDHLSNVLVCIYIRVCTWSNNVHDCSMFTRVTQPQYWN